ncbi:MAG TPA: hypothetical protein VET48_11910, partial [Steroidobacteraceae bacterium]|nr:hypothetical protein [Steroidobacteraceae bacterium]
MFDRLSSGNLVRRAVLDLFGRHKCINLSTRAYHLAKNASEVRVPRHEVGNAIACFHASKGDDLSGLTVCVLPNLFGRATRIGDCANDRSSNSCLIRRIAERNGCKCQENGDTFEDLFHTFLRNLSVRIASIDCGIRRLQVKVRFKSRLFQSIAAKRNVMNGLSIGEVARKTGLATSAIR